MNKVPMAKVVKLMVDTGWTVSPTLACIKAISSEFGISETQAGRWYGQATESGWIKQEIKGNINGTEFRFVLREDITYDML